MCMCVFFLILIFIFILTCLVAAHHPPKSYQPTPPTQVTMSKLTTRDVTDLDTLRHMNLLLREVRAREAGMEGEMEPVCVLFLVG